MRTNLRYLLCLIGGGGLGLLLWMAALSFIKNKPVPNAIFTQSIIDSKIKAASNLNESPKVVFVGGSNVLFGVDSLLFTEITQKPALNFGCAAGMGPELILDLLLPHLIEGDLVVMRWEYGHFRFTRSGDVNLTYLNLLTGPQSGFKKQLPLFDRLKLSMAAPFAHFRHAVVTHYNPYVSPELYKCSWSIDQLGNIRGNEGNELSDQNLLGGYASILNHKGISTDSKNILKNFVIFCKNNGVKLVASWPNILKIPDYLDSKNAKQRFSEISEFWKYIGVPVVGIPEDFTFEKHLFYDTTYHLNAKGVRKCTLLLADQLKPALGDMTSK